MVSSKHFPEDIDGQMHITRKNSFAHTNPVVSALFVDIDSLLHWIGSTVENQLLTDRKIYF